ncbi:MAG: hypothetical protein AAB621_00790 [Patescibacteria group bacterium]
MKTSQQVEKELKEFIERFLLEGKLSVEMVKKWVYEESGEPLEASHKYQDKFFEYFDGTEADVNEVLQIATDAWNYFPHKSLGDKSPHQVAEEYQKKDKRK